MSLLRTVTINGKTVVGYGYDAPTTVDDAVQLLHMERDFRKRAGGYKASDLWFHSDIESKLEQIGLMLLGASVPPLEWKTMTGALATMSPELAQQIFLAGVSTTAAIFSVGEGKIAQLTPENVTTFAYFTGWPQAYWEA